MLGQVVESTPTECKGYGFDSLRDIKVVEMRSKLVTIKLLNPLIQSTWSVSVRKIMRNL